MLEDGIEVGRFTPSSNNYTAQTTSSFQVNTGLHTLRFEGLDPNGGDNTALLDAVFINFSG